MNSYVKLAEKLVDEGNVGAVAALLAIKDQRDSLWRAWRNNDAALMKANDLIRDLQTLNDELTRARNRRCGVEARFDKLRNALSDLLTEADGREYE